ncbi:hypothetical protein JXA88_00710 [Candidatus Fermentibacteria bacterium]|nr:hypothetical protein [Candidatus Fermentibacteria bacterium]
MSSKKPPHTLWCKPTVVAAATAIVALGIALIWSFPLVLAPAELLLGHPGDALSTLQRWESWQPSLRYVERPLLNISGRALADLVGSVTAYNTLVLISFPLTALAAFGLIFRIVPHSPSAMIGALAFTISPFHWAHSLGHLYEAHIQWIPLVAWSLLTTVAHPSLLRMAGLIAASALLVASSFYYGFFAAVVALPIVVLWTLSLLARRRARRLAAVLLATVGAFLASLPITYSYLTWLTRTRRPSSRHFEDLFRYSARLQEYVCPGAFSALRRLLSPATTPGSLHFSNEVEQSLFLGWVVLTLAAIGVGSMLIRRRPSIRRGELAVMLAAGVAATLCSAPPIVRIDGWSIRMPSFYLGSLVPFFRTYARMGVFVHLSVCCAAAAGAELLARRRAASLCAVAVLLIAAEYTPIPPPRTVRLLPLRGAHRWLAQQSDGMLVLEYPMDRRITPRTSVRSWVSRITARYSMEENASMDLRHVAGLGPLECWDLAVSGVGYVLFHDRNPDPSLQVHKDRPDRGPNVPGTWPAVPAHDALTLVAHFPETVLFSVRDVQASVSLSPGEGLAPWREGPNVIGRPFVATSHHVMLRNATQWPVKIGLDMQVVPTAPLRELRLLLNGVPAGAYPAADTIRIALRDLEVLPDRNHLRLEGVGKHGVLPANTGQVGLLLGVRITDEAPARGTSGRWLSAPQSSAPGDTTHTHWLE